MKRLISSVLLALFCIVLPATPGRSGPTAAYLVAGLRAEGTLDFCGEPVALDADDLRERFDREMLLTLWREHQVLLWLKRTPRHLPVIEAELAARGLPDDLKYIAIIESALLPHIGSPKGAIGFWQFIPETARRYGLRVDEYFDDRRNIDKSTTAAARYLKELYDRFGSWTLAAAAYNMGEAGLEASIIEQETRDYYRLYLPLETQRYLFRIICAKRIFEDPRRYGFDLKPSDHYRPIVTATVTAECPRRVPLRLVARAAGTDFKAVKDLNPEIRGYHLPRGRHEIQLPAGTAERFRATFGELVRNWSGNARERSYTVRQGDSLSGIAEKFDIPLPSLLLWNGIDIDTLLHPGDRLVIAPD